MSRGDTMFEDSRQQSVELRRAARELRERSLGLCARTARLKAVSQACRERAIGLIREGGRVRELVPPATSLLPHPGTRTARLDRP
jgi:hypothetical protein